MNLFDDDDDDFDLNESQFRAALRQLEQNTFRLSASIDNLARNLEIRSHEREHGLTKRRLPSVRKTLSHVGEGRAFLEQVAAARGAGRLDQFMARYGDFERWVEGYRREMAAAG